MAPHGSTDRRAVWEDAPQGVGAREVTSLASTSPVREVLDDVRNELRLRRVQVLAALTYLVLASGGLYLFSSIGEDSHGRSDTVYRTTLTAVGIGLLALGVLMGGVTLGVDRYQRRRASLSTPYRPLHSRLRVVVAMAVGAALIAAGLVALARWT